VFFTVALLVTTVYFFLGSVLWLVLERATAFESCFVRDFFGTSKGVAVSIGAATAPSYAILATGLRCRARLLAMHAATFRCRVIPRTEALRPQIQLRNSDAMPSLRPAHFIAIPINPAQLVAFVWSVIAFAP
jgi:hypothetical protein